VEGTEKMNIEHRTSNIELSTSNVERGRNELAEMNVQRPTGKYEQKEI
jgi:hypothetical protein